MAATTSPPPEDRTNKRLKQQEDGGPAIPGPMPPQPPGYGPPPAHYRGPPPPHVPPGAGGYYGGPPPPPPQYGGPPPHHWQGGPPQGPPGYARPSRGLSPDRQGPPPGWNGGGYGRNSPSKGRKPKLKPDKEDPYYHGPPPPGYGPPGYGPPPPGHWQGGPPIYGQPPWSGKTPPRGRHRDPYRHEMEMPHYMSRGQSSIDDDGAGSSAGGSNKEKGRGSYKCGRCGVPKKGHVCPYQPKLKRRPDEPPPQTRTAAVQVEMDEFMTLRRLNIKIQGFPESYATEPYMADTMVVGEPTQGMPVAPPMPPEMPTHMHEMGTSMAPEAPESRDAAIGEGTLDQPDAPP